MEHRPAPRRKVILDIDYRPVLWGLTGLRPGREPLRRQRRGDGDALQPILPDCDVIVGTEEEIHIAGGSTDTPTALARLRDVSQALIVLKRGADGLRRLPRRRSTRIFRRSRSPGFPVEVYNVLGAGDALHERLSARLSARRDPSKSPAAIANACGALVVSRHGCAPASPELDPSCGISSITAAPMRALAPRWRARASPLGDDPARATGPRSARLPSIIGPSSTASPSATAQPPSPHRASSRS